MSIINRNEIRRLQKAARDNDKNKLLEWADLFEQQISNSLNKQYEDTYLDNLQVSIETFNLAIAYTLFFSEETLIDKNRLSNFMQDLFVTVNMFKTGEYTPEDYKKALNDVGVFPDTSYDYCGIYKKFLKTTDTDLVKFLKSENRCPIVFICGNYINMSEMLLKSKQLTLENNIVLQLRSL